MGVGTEGGPWCLGGRLYILPWLQCLRSRTLNSKSKQQDRGETEIQRGDREGGRGASKAQTDADFKGKERTSSDKVTHVFIFLGALHIPQLAGSRVLYKYELSCRRVPFTEHREGSRTPKGNHDYTFSCDSWGPLNRLVSAPRELRVGTLSAVCSLTGPGQRP